MGIGICGCRPAEARLITPDSIPFLLRYAGITVADVAPLVRQAFEEVFDAQLVVPTEGGGGDGPEALLAEMHRLIEQKGEEAAAVLAS